MNNDQVIQSLIGNAIVTTAYLANEICIQTKGEFIIPEPDYLNLVKQFQFRLSKRIMPVNSGEDIKEEAQKFIAELLEKSKETQDGNNTDGSSENKIIG